MDTKLLPIETKYYLYFKYSVARTESDIQTLCTCSVSKRDAFSSLDNNCWSAAIVHDANC